MTSGVTSGDGSSTANITFADGFGLGSSTRNITIGSNGTYTLSGSMTGSGGLTVNKASGATGTLVLSNASNGFTGDLTVNGGTLSTGSTGGFSAANISLGGGASFNVATRGGFSMNSAQGLKLTGNGSAATLVMATSNGFTTSATTPISFTAYDGSTAPLTLSGAGTLTLTNGTSVKITPTATLNPGNHLLISKGTGSVAATAPTSVTVNNVDANTLGLCAGCTASTTIDSSGLELVVAVFSPTTQASNITFAGVQSDRMGVYWTNGDGSRRIVKINTTNSFTPPADGTDPAANNIYSGSDEQVVFNGSGSMVFVRGLSAATNYFFRVYEANGTGTSSVYLTSTASNNPTSQATTPTLVSIALAPLNTSIGLPGTQQYTATGTFSDSSSRALVNAPGTWSTKAPMVASGREAFASATVAGRIYVAGGDLNGGSFLSSVEAYNPVANSWSNKASLPAGRVGPSAASVNGKMYLFGGQTAACAAGVTGLTLEYDPSTDAWTSKASMNTPRVSAGAVVVNGLLYAVAGYTINGGCGSDGSAAIEVYDPVANTWTSKAPMSLTRSDTGVGTVGGKIYVVGGYVGATPKNDVQIYNTSTDSWSTGAPMPTARGDLSVIGVNGKLYAMGGYNGTSVVNTVEIYDPATDSWSTGPGMITGRDYEQTAEVGGTVYALGGCTSCFPAVKTNEALALGEVSWSSSDRTKATIGIGALATAVDYGSTTITATDGTVSGNTGLTVVPSPTVVTVVPSSGATIGGDTITINGTNLSSATSVKFGTTSAAILTNSATQITATSPAHVAGTVEVTVTTAYGTSATGNAGDQFTYFVDTPHVTTNAADGISATGATLHGTANPEGDGTIGYFRYSMSNPTNCDNSFGTATTPTHNLQSGTSDVDFFDTLSGLQPLTKYYFCAVASNSAGLGFGLVQNFTTPMSAPLITLSNPTSPSKTSTTPTFSGTSQLGSTSITLHKMSDCSDAAVGTADGTTGSWTSTAVTVDPNKTTTIFAQASNGVLTSGCSNGFAYTHDNTAPAPPVFGQSDPPTPNPSSTATLQGTAEKGSTVKIYRGAGCNTGNFVNSGPANGTTNDPTIGAFAIDVSGLVNNNPNLFSATATDLAGNISDCSATFTYNRYDVPTVTGVSPSSGPNTGGTTIVVTGTNFAVGQTTVAIDGVNCPVIPDSGHSDDPNSSLQVYCTTGAHSTGGSYGVGVTTPGGSSNDDVLFTYIAPQPDLVAVKSSDLPPGEAWTRQFGSSGFDQINGIAVDAAGNNYAAGSTDGQLPGQTTSGSDDAVVRKYDSDGNEIWTRQFGTSDSDYAYGIAVDAAGNSYVTGYTFGTFTGQTSSGSADAFVRKYDSGGNEVWTRQFGSSRGDVAYGIAVDAAGNSYVGGYTQGTLPGQTSSGLQDAFVRKYDAAGNEVWTRQFGTGITNAATGIAVDTAGNSYVAGYTDGALRGQTSSGSTDIFVRKYDSGGNEVWTRQFGSDGGDYAYGIAVDAAGNSYAAGSMQGTLPGQTSSGAEDAFVRKYDIDGNIVWTRQFGSSGNDSALGIAVDAAGNSYIGGYTDGTFPGQTNSSSIDAFVREYDAAGYEVWTRQFGSSDVDIANGIGVDAAGNSYTGGRTLGTLPGQTSAGSADSFVRKYAGGTTACPGSWTWTVTVINQGSGDAVFAGSQTIVLDDLPNTTISYGAPSPANFSGVTGSGNIGSGISANTLTVSTTGPVTIAPGGSFTVSFTATTSAGGTFANPRSSGTASVDPNNVVTESNEGNNTFTGSVTVDACAPPTVTIAVSPESVYEDGAANLVYTFTRTGDTTSGLDVNFATGGTADSFDYSISPSDSVHFDVGAATATVTVSPVMDSTYENDETVTLTITTGSGYQAGDPNSATGTILNDDPLPPTTYSVSGKVSFNTMGLSDVVITASGSGCNTMTTTDGSGAYTISGIAIGTSCTLTPSLSGYQFTPLSQSANHAVADLDFTASAETTTTISNAADLANNSTPYGENYTIEFSVTSGAAGNISGTVDVTADGTTVCSGVTLDMNASGSCTVTNPIGGTYSLAAHYNGNSPYLASDSTTVNHTVDPIGTTLVVNTTSDHDPDGFCVSLASGDCTLREAIIAANFDSDISTIDFSIPDAGVHTISLGSVLPTLDQQTIIDGYTQLSCSSNVAPCSKPNTQTNSDDAVVLVEVNGSGISGSSNDGFVLGANSSVSGLVIAGFSGSGIRITANGSGSTVTGNFIGTDSGGSTASANGVGITIDGALGTLIGCTVPDERNVISGNTGHGIVITGGASINYVQGNFIGLAVDGTAALGNGGSGVEISSDPSGGSIYNVIGTGPPSLVDRPNGPTFAHKCQAPHTSTQNDTYTPANFIANNSGDGVRVAGTADVNNTINQNVIYNNGGLGINLVGGANEDPNGVTPNDTDPGDTDTGPNNLQNFPVILSADGGTNTISGTLNSTPTPNGGPDSVFQIDFYSNASCDASGYGEGQAYIGTFTTTRTDANGDVAFTFNPPSSLTVGSFITATATDTQGNTSEFSQCVQVAAPASDTTPPTITYTPLKGTASTADIPFNVTVTDNVAVDPNSVTVHYSINGVSSSSTCADNTGGSFTCTIPGSGSGTAAVSYYVTASDTASNASASPNALTPNLYTVGPATIPGGEYTNVGLSPNTALGDNVVVDGNLDLEGIVNAGGFILTLGCDGTVTGAGQTAYVIGKVKKSICQTGDFTFPVGTTLSTTSPAGASDNPPPPMGFSPFTAHVTPSSQDASLTVFVVDASLPGSNAAQSASRYWDVTQTGELTADISYVYLDQDVNGVEGNYQPLKRENGFTNVVTGTVAADTNTVSVNGVLHFSQWGAGALAPTAARVSIGGRVTTTDGRGIANVVVNVTGGFLTEPLLTRTNAFGYYMFEGLSTGNSYLVTVSARDLTFSQPSRVISLRDSLTDLDFIADPQ